MAAGVAVIVEPDTGIGHIELIYVVFKMLSQLSLPTVFSGVAIAAFGEFLQSCI